MASIALMHRYLTQRPTHITAFLEHTSSFSGVLDRLTGRLEIGFDQLMDTPLAAIPVVGTLVLLGASSRTMAAPEDSAAGVLSGNGRRRPEVAKRPPRQAAKEIAKESP